MEDLEEAEDSTLKKVFLWFIALLIWVSLMFAVTLPFDYRSHGFSGRTALILFIMIFPIAVCSYVEVMVIPCFIRGKIWYGFLGRKRKKALFMEVFREMEERKKAQTIEVHGARRSGSKKRNRNESECL
ncbi:hypothetical protein [Candidatus Poriferisocius sp.]|uniref:hypothetical protein n=1 Tax=Candidatus Poriferisocius sp. TaxID=3101276 RepID=UPI003B0115C4